MGNDTHLVPATGPIDVITGPQEPVTRLIATSPAPTKRLSPGEVVTISVLDFSAFVAFLSEMVVRRRQWLLGLT